MSLINQMLRDLETRRADSSEKSSLPDEVRSLPAAAAGPRWLKPLLAIFMVIGAVAAVRWWGSADLSVPPSTPMAPTAPVAPTAPAAPVPRPEPLLRLDSDLTAARVAPALPEAPRPAAPVERPQTPPLAKAGPPAAASAAPAPQIEKRAPTADVNASATHRAREQLNAGQRDAAEATLKQALLATPGDVAARQMLFGLLMEQRRGDEALTLLKEGLAAHPEQTQWASNAARLQVDKSDLAGAWETLQGSLPAAAGQGEYRAFCGTVLSRLKRYGEAIEHYQAALRTNQTEGRWWVGMALAFEAQGKMPESRAAFARAQASGNLPPELAAYVESKLRQ